ncbi:RNA-directed DNA polymerase [Gregarina niphandrodes]|uniref:RNA-directed DNA polymerase n=1 Tax=Gregarina niphandrodes TaxID=110365 RepID=A0A023B422_GRENI|nr:RNA-directed DNA polymerase [Gregarina niphandrodes]EZG55888.1 RNA-directed DNA polymerase [Gregarina niphandrodes]|eukprot:XP_011131430.1 RNA-directed DNA polymerase [Gregarina niphandrodes]
MNTLFADVLAGTEVRIYIDDIVVGTRDFIRHEELLLTVLRRLVKHRFALSWGKVELFKPEVRFLGCIIGKVFRSAPARTEPGGKTTICEELTYAEMDVGLGLPGSFRRGQGNHSQGSEWH